MNCYYAWRGHFCGLVRGHNDVHLCMVIGCGASGANELPNVADESPSGLEPRLESRTRVAPATEEGAR